MARTIAVVALLLGVASAVAACGGTSGPAAAPAAAPGAPGSIKPDGDTVPIDSKAAIVAFDVPDTVTCDPGATSYPLHVTYRVTGSTNVVLKIDGRSQPVATAPSGTLDAPVHCDGIAHTIALIVTDDEGHPTGKSTILITKVPSLGN